MCLAAGGSCGRSGCGVANCCYKGGLAVETVC